jgi:hypothetical protein
MSETRTINVANLDSAVGANGHESWQQIREQFTRQQARAYENRSRYSQAWATSLRRRLDADLALAEKAAEDYLAFLARVSANEDADASEGRKILDVLVPAIAVLGSVNDLLDDMFALKISALLIALEGASLETEARSLQNRLSRLREELDKARREVKEASTQQAIDGAIAGATACSGPLRFLARGAGGFGQMVADNYLGPSSANPATWGGRGNRTFDPALSAWEKYIAESSKVALFSDAAGKNATVAGLIFDAGYSNRGKLIELIDDTRSYHEWFVSRLKANHAVLAGLPIKFDVLARDVQKRANGWTAQLRQRLLAAMRETEYWPGS